MRLVECKKKEGDNNSVFAIALVEEPAIMFDFVYLSDNPKPNLIKLAEEKQMIYTPVLIPDQRIVRMDSDNNPYQIFFSAATIEQAAQDYMTAKITDEFNSEHTGQKLADVQVVENWIVEDPSNDKSTTLGFDVPKGTWMQGIKINDAKTLAKVKDGTYKGISIEGYFDEYDNKLSKLNKLEMKETNNKLDSILTKLTAFMSPKTVKMASAQLDGGGAIYTEGEFSQGAAIYSNEEMTEVAGDGSYTLDSGEVVTVEGGIFVSASAPEEVEANKDIEQLTEIAENQVLATEKLNKENESLKEELSELSTELSAIKELVTEHVTKLAKVEVKAESPASVTQLSVGNAPESRFSNLRNKVRKS